MTIHKIQGQTLNKVKIDLGEGKLRYGLATVAFSRTKLLSDMQISPFKPENVFEFSKDA